MKRLFSFVMVLSLLLCLTACGNGSQNTDTEPPVTTPETPVTTPAPETTPPPPSAFTIVEGKQCTYTIVRPEQASSAVIKAAQDLQQYIMDNTDATVKITDDWVMRDTDPDDAGKYEILIGGTNRSADDVEVENGWHVEVKDTKIIIVASRAAYYSAAVKYLTSLFEKSEGTMKLSVNTQHTESIADSYANVNTTLRVCSYNIKHGADVGLDMSVIAKDITDLSLDIIGFQEIDQKTSRVNGLDTMKALSEASGYKYYAFAKAINYKGGEYGTGILSRYPIVEFEVIKLDSGSEEQRCVGHAVIDVDGVYFDFFNTHLSFESLDLRTKQYKQLAEQLIKCETYILTGDFNTANMKEFSVLPDATLVNSGKYGTFPSSGSAIDNIVISKDWNIVDSGIGPKGHSDHILLWAELKFERK